MITSGSGRPIVSPRDDYHTKRTQSKGTPAVHFCVPGPAHTDQPSQKEMAVMPKITLLCSPSLGRAFLLFLLPSPSAVSPYDVFRLCPCAPYCCSQRRSASRKGRGMDAFPACMAERCFVCLAYDVRRAHREKKVCSLGCRYSAAAHLAKKERHDLQLGHPPSSTRFRCEKSVCV